MSDVSLTPPDAVTDNADGGVSGGVRPTIARLARSTAIVMVLLSVAKVISLLQKLIIVQRFGVGAEWDTFVAANQVPEQIFNLIAGGALSYAFIPVFGGLLTRGDRPAAWRLASNVVNSVFLVALLISGIVFFAAPWLVTHIVAPGFSAENAAQTVGLMRVLLISLLLFSISGLAIGVLQSYQHFLLPALAPILYDVGVLFGAAVLARRFGVYGIAYGAVLGAAGYLLIQVPGLIRFGMRWRPTLNVRDPDLRHVIQLMIPRAIGLGLLNINLLVAISLASNLGAGAPSAYSWGWALMQLPETLIGTAMGTVIFPTLAVLSAAGNLAGKRAAMNGALRFILIFTIPGAFLMVLVGRPLIGLLQGGAFDAAGADAVFSVLVLFAPGLIVHSSVEIVARSFYADKDTVTPLYVALLSAVINIGLALLLIGPLGVRGLALANTIAVSIEVLTLIIILRRRWQGLNDAVLLETVLKTLVASLVMSAVVLGASIVLGGQPAQTSQAMILTSQPTATLALVTETTTPTPQNVAVTPTLPSIITSLPGSTSFPTNGGHGSPLVRVIIELMLGGLAFIVTGFVLRMREIAEFPRLLAQREAPAAE